MAFDEASSECRKIGDKPSHFDYFLIIVFIIVHLNSMAVEDADNAD